jgi:hypothetical protein
MMKPVTIKYRDGEQRVASVRADRCSGEIPAYSDTFYCIFYRKGLEVARVAKSRLLPGYYKVWEKLFGRPWLEKVRSAEKILLSKYRDWEDEIEGYPKDTVQVWAVNYDKHTWVIMCENRCILHIMNNDEVTRRGKPREAIKKLFPGKKVTMLQTTVTEVEL